MCFSLRLCIRYFVFQACYITIAFFVEAMSTLFSRLDFSRFCETFFIIMFSYLFTFVNFIPKVFDLSDFVDYGFEVIRL